MRRRFESLPIHQKLVASALLITGVALFVAMLGLSAFDAWRYRVAAGEDADALASVLAENTAATVMFNQPDAAEEILRSVRVRNVVTRVCIFLPSGELFAGFSPVAAACPAFAHLDNAWRGITGSAAIARNGREYGTVVIERTLGDLQGRLLLTGLAGLAMFACAALAAYPLAQRVNAAISRPITNLARFARAFDDSSSVELPPMRTAPDELGELIASFRDMVTRVRTAGDELRRSHDALLEEKAEREAALLRQLESERRFETLADGSPVLLWVNGPDGCEFVNRAYLEFVGLESDGTVRGFDWSCFVHPDDRDPYTGAYRDAFRRRAAFRAEFRFRRFDGEWRWMRSEATPRVEGEAFVGYVGASVDITERRRAEEALMAADQRKDAFLAILAHELRNPLAPLRAGIELLRLGGDKPGALARVLPVLERQVAHMVRLIDDLMDVSRITSGKIQLQRQPTPLVDLVHGAIDANRTAIEAAELDFRVDVPDTPVLLDVDPTRFVQVLSNLLNNAVKFTDRGGHVALVARLHDHVTEPRVSIQVRDSGAGIAPATLPHIFDFFVQGENPGRGKSGLGIGLGLVKQLVEMQGGTIAAESEGEGLGSIFTVDIPVRVADARTTPVRDEIAEQRRTIDRRVLIIDDNVDAAETLAALVNALGGQAATAFDGRSGIRCFVDFLPDVVLLDIGMPVMDGYETCRRLRAEQAGPSTFVVALTGFGQQHDRERALAEGFDAHLTKPADPQALASLLADAPPRPRESTAG